MQLSSSVSYLEAPSRASKRSPPGSARTDEFYEEPYAEWVSTWAPNSSFFRSPSCGKPLLSPFDRELVVDKTWWEPRLLGPADRSLRSYCFGDASASPLTELSVAIRLAYDEGRPRRPLKWSGYLGPAAGVKDRLPAVSESANYRGPVEGTRWEAATSYPAVLACSTRRLAPWGVEHCFRTLQIHVSS